MRMPALRTILTACALAFASLCLGGPAGAMPFGLIDDPELECLALNVYFEARSEPVAGQLAVAHTTLNRVGDRAFPNTVCGVVAQGGEAERGRCQFSWWCDGKSDTVANPVAWRHAVAVARRAVAERWADPTHGAIYFHAASIHPKWTRTLQFTGRFGSHLFYR